MESQSFHILKRMSQFTQHIKLSEMARLLSRSVKQFRADVSKYSIPHILIGRAKVFDPIRVIEYLIARTPNFPEKPKRSFHLPSSELKNISPNSPKSKEIERYKKMVGLE